MALWEAIISIVLVVLCLVVMAFEWAPPDFAMMGCGILFICLQIITVEDEAKGFANTGMQTVAVLFIIAKALGCAGALELVTKFFKMTARFVDGHGARPLVYHITVPIGLISAFLNNTPIVAMMLPVIIDYARAQHIAPSKLLIPLSFGTIFGGTITLIGTSTNLVVKALAQESIPDLEFGLFDLTPVGLPVFFAGILYLGLFAARFLPDRMGVSESVQNPREYMVEMIVQENAPFAGKTVEKAGLRNLVGLFLARVEREGESTPAPGHDFVVQKGDKLYFAGEVDSVLQLTAVKGLKLADEAAEEKDLHRLTRTEEMVEVVLSNSSPLVNKTVRETHFRSHYNAAIVAVHRAGERIHGRIGDIRLQMGDTLLLVANPDFHEQHEKDAAFALVSKVSHFRPVQRRMAPFAILVAIAMIVVASTTDLDLLLTAWVALAIFLICKIISPSDARAALNLEILICIAASFGISQGLVKSGGAKLVAKGLVKMAKPFGKPGLLIFLYITTVLFSAVVTNSAAVAIMFPIAQSATAGDESYHINEILIVLMMGAADYFTPIGYQTNMMVYGPGGYVFSDYVKFGGVLQIWMLIFTIPCILFRKWWYIWTIVLILVNVIVFGLSIRGPKKIVATAGTIHNAPRELQDMAEEQASPTGDVADGGNKEGEHEGSVGQGMNGRRESKISIDLGADENTPLEKGHHERSAEIADEEDVSIRLADRVRVDVDASLPEHIVVVHRFRQETTGVGAGAPRSTLTTPRMQDVDDSKDHSV
eukprot:jgi/Mesvir1/11916/Mv00254-RA.1